MMTPQLPIERFSIFATGLDHPECCAFDRGGNLWAGGEAGQVYRIDPSGKVQTVCSLGTFNGGIAFSPRDELHVCNPAQGVVRVNRDGSHGVFVSHAGKHRILCANFALFDRAGNMYVTDSGQWKKQNGYLVRSDPRGKAEIVAGPFGYANGLALSSDERTLYMVESNTDRVLRFDISQNGAVSEAKVFAENVGRMPDGLALDAAGNVYVACYASDEIWRISPAGEKQLLAWDHFAILLSRPTNIAFGGENFDEIFVPNLGRQTITRAKIGVVGQKLANQNMKPQMNTDERR
jgi:gluconolactonase